MLQFHLDFSGSRKQQITGSKKMFMGPIGLLKRRETRLPTFLHAFPSSAVPGGPCVIKIWSSSSSEAVGSAVNLPSLALTFHIFVPNKTSTSYNTCLLFQLKIILHLTDTCSSEHFALSLIDISSKLIHDRTTLRYMPYGYLFQTLHHTEHVSMAN